MANETQTWADLQDAGCAQSQLVLQAIARHANWDTGKGFCAVREIARMAKCSMPTARRHIHRLRDDDLIAIEPGRRNDGAQSSNTITLVGYAEWIAAVRSGGIVAKPRRTARYVEADLGHDNDPRMGQDSGGDEPPPPSQPDSPPPLNLIGGPSQQVIGGPSQQVIGGPSQQGDRGILELPLDGHINLPPPTPSFSTSGTQGGGEETSSDQAMEVPRPGIDTRGWHKGWDQAARNAVSDLVADPYRSHVATHLLIPLVGTLGPPVGVHGASYVRDLAAMLRPWPDAVLAAAAVAIRADRVRDLPAASKVRNLCKLAASAMAAGAPKPGTRGEPPPDVDAWVVELTRGDAADPTIAMSRALVGRLGAAAAHAWFAEAHVTRDGNRVTITLDLFKARYVSGHMEADVLLAARVPWPETTQVRVTSTATPFTGAAA